MITSRSQINNSNFKTETLIIFTWIINFLMHQCSLLRYHIIDKDHYRASPNQRVAGRKKEI